MVSCDVECHLIVCGGRVFCGAAMGGAAMARGLPRGAMRSCGWLCGGVLQATVVRFDMECPVIVCGGFDGTVGIMRRRSVVR